MEPRRQPTAGIFVALLMSAMMLLPCIASVASATSDSAPPEAIDGYVRDTSGNPISGATVRDLSGSGTATSNSNGYYAFGVTTGGTHSVKASKTGYSDQTISVFISTRTGLGTGNFNLVPIHNNVAYFSKSSYPDDQNIFINYVHANDGSTLNVNLYKPDGTLAQTYSNLAVGSGQLTFAIYGQQPGIWKMVATTSIYGSWTRTVPVGFITIDYIDDYGKTFSNLLVGMGKKTTMGSDTSGVTTAIGAEVFSYVNEGGAYSRTINIRVSAIYKDNNPQQGDSINMAFVSVEKVAWDPDGSGSQSAYGSTYSIPITAIRFLDGGRYDSASDVLHYPSGATALGTIGDVALAAASAAAASGPGLAVDVAWIAGMTALDAWSTSNFMADFGGDTGAGVEWDNGVPCHQQANTFNMVKLYLGAEDTSYAFKISAVFTGVSHVGDSTYSYEIVSSPIYICVTP